MPRRPQQCYSLRPHKLGPQPAVPQVTTVTRPNQTRRRKRVLYHPPPPTVQRGLAGESTCSGYRGRKNQNYFPQGCELERIKSNLGTGSALSAPRDKIFCSQHVSAGGEAGPVVPATPHVPGHSLCSGDAGGRAQHPSGSSAGLCPLVSPQVGRRVRALAQPAADFPRRRQVTSTSRLS